jgi:hypothetical protein
MIGFFVKYIQKKTPKKKKPIRARKKNLRRPIKTTQKYPSNCKNKNLP